MILIFLLFLISVEAFKNITLMKEYAKISSLDLMSVKTDGTVDLLKKKNIWRYDYFYRILKLINHQKPVSKNLYFLISDWDEPLLLRDDCYLIETEWNFHIRNHQIVVPQEDINHIIAISTSATPNCHLDIIVPYIAMSHGYLNINSQNIPNWENKKPILFWRGSATGGMYNNNSLYSNHRYRTLKFLSKFEWADVKFSNIDEIRSIESNLTADHVDINYMCQYKYLLNIAGWSSAYRLHMLSKCGSVIISLSPILDLIDHALYPYYYRINSEQEIPQIMNFLLNHDIEAQNIANLASNQVKQKINYNIMVQYSQNFLKQLEQEDFV